MRLPKAEMERHLPADNAVSHFLAMMVRALRAVDLLAKSAAFGSQRRWVAFPSRGCPCCARCTRARSKYQGRVLAVMPRPEHEALAAARALEGTVAGKRLYAQRNGVEGTLSQAVRAFGLRRARYRGLAKTGLQHVATAAALNLDRITAWVAGRPLAPTRASRFAALAA